MMCYSVIDNRELEQMSYILYGKSSNDSSFQALPVDDKLSEQNSYPKVYTYPYPKPGKAIPKIHLMVTKMTDRNEIKYKALPVREPFDNNTKYYLSVGPVWTSAYEFVAIWTRRNQDVAIIAKCREQSTEWHCKRLTEEKQLRPIGSLVLQSRPIVSDSGRSIFMPLPISEGVYGTYNHIAQITMDGKKQFLTHGQFVVTDIFAYREDLQTM